MSDDEALAEVSAGLIEEVLRQLPASQRGVVIDEAMRQAGTSTIPADHDGFQHFVEGPFRQAAYDQLGPKLGETLLEELRFRIREEAATFSTLPMSALRARHAETNPEQDDAVEVEAQVADDFDTLPYEDLQAERAYVSEAPAAEAPEAPAETDFDTLPYEDLEAARAYAVDPVTLALVGSDHPFERGLRELLEGRGHRLHLAADCEEVVALVREAGVEVVVANLDPGGYAFARELQRALGRATAEVLLLGGTLSLHAPRPGVTRVLPKMLDASLVEAIEEMAGRRPA